MKVTTNQTKTPVKSTGLLKALGFQFAIMLPLLAFASPAHAEPVDGYSGMYDLSCAQANLSVNLFIAGPGGAQSYGLTAPMYCVPNSKPFLNKLAKLQKDLTKVCLVVTKWSVFKCQKEAKKVRNALYDTNKALVLSLAEKADMTVYESGNWLAKLLNLYPFKGKMWLANKKVVPAAMFINRSGRFWAAGIKPLGGNTGSGAGCIALVLGSITGQINAKNNYSVTSEYGLSGSITCLAGNGTGGWLIVSAGIAFHGTVTGSKM